MANNWFLTRADKKYGPYPLAQMKTMASGGQLLPTDMVMEEGATNWMPASQVPDFFPSSGSAPPPPPLPPPIAPESAEWHYTQNGAQAGPVTWTQLRQRAASSQLQPSDMIWKAGMPAWAAASSISNLFPPPSAAPPPLPPALATALVPALVDRVSGEIVCRGQQGGLNFGPAQYEVMLDGQKIGVGSVTGGFTAAFETQAGQHTLLLVRDHGVGNAQFPLDLQNTGHYTITLAYPAKKKQGWLAKAFDFQGNLDESIGLPKEIDIGHNPQTKKLPRAMVIDADAIPAAAQETLVQKSQREKEALRQKQAEEQALLQQKWATVARRGKLHGLWEPVNDASQWFLFTKDMAMLRGDGFATKFRWLTDDIIELYADDTPKTVVFTVLSIGDVELILKTGDQSGHFKRGVSITEAELQKREAEARKRRAESAANFAKVAGGVASVLAAGGFAVLCAGAGVGLAGAGVGLGAAGTGAGSAGGGGNMVACRRCDQSGKDPEFMNQPCKHCHGKGWSLR